MYMDGHSPRNVANRNLVRLYDMSRDQKFIEAQLTISWILISWKGLNRQARVCICNEP